MFLQREILKIEIMKKLVIAIAACVCALSASAQWGIQAGANFSTLDNASISGAFLKTATGYSAGLTYDAKLFLGLGLNTGLHFIQRNVEEREVPTGGTGGDLDFLNRFSSLELPLNLKYQLHSPLISPFVIGGPYIDCGLWAQSNGEKLSYGDELNRFNFGVTLGLGVDIVKHLRVMYQYDWGLTDIAADKDWAGYFDGNNRSHRVSVGILF